MTEVFGQDPTTEDLLWSEVAADLAPDKSLARMNADVEFIFKNLALVGTVLAGAGLVTVVPGHLHSESSWLKLVLVLTSVSITLAFLANLPSMKSEINPANVTAVQDFYERRIRWKGWLTRVALLTFLAALLIAFVIVFWRFDAKPDAAISLSVTRDPKTMTVAVRATVQAQGLDRQVVEETTVTGNGSTEGSVTLFHAFSAPDPDGKLVVDASVVNLAGYKSFQMTTLARSGSRVVGPSRSLTVSP